jgi:hypothetical protein
MKLPNAASRRRDNKRQREEIRVAYSNNTKPEPKPEPKQEKQQ